MATFCFDLDNTLCRTKGTDYTSSEPMYDRIEHVNGLYELGHTVIIHTARGSLTGLDLETLTRTQLEEWGVKFHHLQLGKPAADYYVDDRAIHSEEYQWSNLTD